MTEHYTHQPMYENGSLSGATGGALRPGGIDLTERMIGLCNLSAGDMVLDVGCGTGSTVRHLLDNLSVYPIGIDRSELLLQTGISNDPRLPLVCAWGKSLPVMSGQVNAILAECSLSAMSDLNRTLDEFNRVLQTGGRLAITDVYARNADGVPALRVLPFSCGLRDAMTKNELALLLRAHGFEILIWEDHSDTLQYSMHSPMHGCHGFMSANALEIQTAINKAKLGYYLLLARKM